jgi:beta-lactam-binding protein with PASTA domain
MNKNQIVTIIVVVVLVFAGMTGWFLMQKSKITEEGENGQKQEQEAEEIFSLSAVVSSIDTENNFLMVSPVNQESEIKVVVSEGVKLIKVEFPFDPKNPPKEGSFSPIQKPIEFSDFQEGDNVFIKAKENIAGKTEISNIEFIHILP